MKLWKWRVNLESKYLMSLSQDPITEDIEETIHNIYGQFALFVEGVENLPSHLSPLLKNY